MKQKQRPRQDHGIDGQTVYIKWNDDRGRSFENVVRFMDWSEYIEFTYSNPETGRANIRVYKKEIRWLEFYDTPIGLDDTIEESMQEIREE